MPVRRLFARKAPPTGYVPVLAHYYQELLNYFARAVRSRDRASDLVHEAYTRVLALEQSGQVVEQPRALLYRTARNLLIDQHRRQAVRAPHTANDAADGPQGDEPLPDVADLPAPAALGPEAQAASAQGMAALLATIDALPLRCRQAFILHKFDGLPQAEVAARMGISRKMVEQHIQRAMLACRQCREALEQGRTSGAAAAGASSPQTAPKPLTPPTPPAASSPDHPA
jgi:RNA polymerase sigma-70 factor (ECF subfamily)